jgi:hypothetical protein
LYRQVYSALNQASSRTNTLLLTRCSALVSGRMLFPLEPLREDNHHIIMTNPILTELITKLKEPSGVSR